MNAREIARALGRRGGRARARRLSAAERSRVASLGGKARAASVVAARRIAVNLSYAAVLRELQGPTDVTRLRTFDGPLPGVDPSRP